MKKTSRIVMDQTVFYHLNPKKPAPQFTIDPSSIGSILEYNDYDKYDKFIGSGFVAANGRLVVTSAHSLKDNKGVIQQYSDGVLKYHTAEDMDGKNTITYPLSIVKILEEYDLVLLKSEDVISKTPFELASTFSFPFGSQIFYYGFDKADVKHQNYNRDANNIIMKQEQGRHIYESVVIRNGETSFKKSIIVKYLEYYGFSVPGFSGGVTLNYKGEILGVNTHAWVTHGFKDLETDLQKNENIQTLNQAVSIQYLRQTIDDWLQNHTI